MRLRFVAFGAALAALLAMTAAIGTAQGPAAGGSAEQNQSLGFFTETPAQIHGQT